MIWLLMELLEHSKDVQGEINGKWVPARPVSGPFRLRLRAAWEVLVGRADAFKWPEGQ